MREAQIAIAETHEQTRRCFTVMRELRGHIADAEVFVERVERQRGKGYKLVFVESAGEIRAVAGYRLLENLFSGRFLYLDDLVTREADRSQGYGDRLFDWLVAEARAGKCTALVLDSGVQRFAAHRFYLRKRMDITSYHFQLTL